jgi:hypothetical protein
VSNRPICGGQTVSLQALCFRGLWEVEMKEVFFRSFGTKLTMKVYTEFTAPSMTWMFFMRFSVGGHRHAASTAKRHPAAACPRGPKC